MATNKSRNCGSNNANSMGGASQFIVALLATMLAIELVLVPITSMAQPTGLSTKAQTNYNSNNNLDVLISDLIDDASHRLKKSKAGRHLKSSLRFGRRSDPLLAPTELDELQDNNALYQSPYSLD